MIETLINETWPLLLPEHRAARPEWPTWEKARLSSMHQNIGKGDVIYYVGAEEGDMAALCALWGSEVVLIEPNPLVWPNIKAIWEANKLPKPLAMVSGFASNTTKEVSPEDIFDWPSSANGQMIGDHGFKELKTQGEVFSQYRIDDLVKMEGMKPPTAISIDVEGSEFRVIEGAVETLQAYYPQIWLSGHPEFMFSQYKEYLSDLRALIKSIGYTETLLAYEHEVHLFYDKSL